MARRYEARNVSALSNTGIVGSNNIRGVFLCLHCPAFVVAFLRDEHFSFLGYNAVNLSKINRRLGGIYRLYLQGWRINQARNHLIFLHFYSSLSLYLCLIVKLKLITLFTLFQLFSFIIFDLD